ncbi:hypothetical protein [Flavobacterium sp. FlaQc-48]|uniref:hypothetical protein n=1 Tax=Flavobacterium sp. FlaQc-48 TaxID=3374181 RepID=UPI003756DF8A
MEEQFVSTEKIEPDLEVRAEENEINANNKRKKLNFTVVTILIALISTLSIHIFKIPYEYLKYILIVLYSLTVGIYFWLIREHYRLLYGFLELFAGLSTIFIILNSIDFNFSFITWKFEKIIGIIGGLYIMVRGIDNISKTKFGQDPLGFFSAK